MYTVNNLRSRIIVIHSEKKHYVNLNHILSFPFRNKHKHSKLKFFKGTRQLWDQNYKNISNTLVNLFIFENKRLNKKLMIIP